MPFYHGSHPVNRLPESNHQNPQRRVGRKHSEREAKTRFSTHSCSLREETGFEGSLISFVNPPERAPLRRGPATQAPNSHDLPLKIIREKISPPFFLLNCSQKAEKGEEGRIEKCSEGRKGNRDIHTLNSHFPPLHLPILPMVSHKITKALPFLGKEKRKEFLFMTLETKGRIQREKVSTGFPFSPPTQTNPLNSKERRLLLQQV